jgi:hypothetical protein
MSEKAKKTEQDELGEIELEQQEGEPLPDRGAMSVINPPFVQSPGITLPVEPPE